MKERDFKQFGNFIVREGGKDTSHYYRVKTSHPQVEWKFRPSTFMYALLGVYKSEPTAENAEMIAVVLTSLYYVCTVQDAEVIKMIYEHIAKTLNTTEVSEDESNIEDVKNGVYAQGILSSMGHEK